MVKVTLYGDREDNDTQQVLVLLEELNLDYKLREKEKDIPFCNGPMVKYGEVMLYGPMTMMRYICKANDDILDLYFSAEVEMWMEIVMNEFVSRAKKIISSQSGESELESVLDEYEKHLEGKVNGLVDGRYSAVDIAHVPYVYELMKLGYKSIFKKRANVYSWLKKIMRRSATRHVLQ